MVESGGLPVNTPSLPKATCMKVPVRQGMTLVLHLFGG